MKLYLAVTASNLGMMSIGLFFGWSSPSLSLLLQGDSPVELTLEQASWVASLVTVGGLVGSVTCIFLVNIIGRKQTLLLTVVPSVIGWLLIAFATAPWELYVARLLCGVSAGNAYIAGVMYLGEISPAQTRGILTSTLTVATKFGAFLELAIGPFLSVKNLALVSLSFPIIFFLIFVWLPESPYHLMRRGRRDEATVSLVQLRGKTDVSKEAEIIEKSVEAELAHDTGLREIFFVSGNRKAFTVIIGLLIIQQWSGSFVVLSYAQMIFDASNGDIEGKYLTIILGAVQVVCTILCAATVDRYGRRPLLMISTFGTAVSTTMIGVYFFLQHARMETSNIGWLPGAGAILYITSYCFGLAGLPFTMMSEVFPTNVKALANTIAMIGVNLCAFIVVSSYQKIAETFGIYTPFWLFSTFSTVGLVFIYFYVPETKGKTLQEIQIELHRRKLQ